MFTKSLSCGSKIFIIGEYLALTGGPSLVASVEPGFSLLPSESFLESAPGSPTQRLIAESGSIQGRLHDPSQGEGGLGRSSAEFAFGLYSLGTRDVKEAYEHFRRITVADSQPPPSGYDLVAQWLGGAHWITGSRPDELDCEPIRLPVDWRFLLFSATHSRKTPTHAHLAQLAEMDFESLRASVELARASIQGEDLRGMGEAMNHFADELYSLGLEHPEAHEDRMVLHELPGVAGVKGSGALLSDLMIVLLNDEARLQEIVAHAQERGLKLFSAGLRISPPLRAL